MLFRSLFRVPMDDECIERVRTMEMWENMQTKYDPRHGGAYDRGAADSYYGRPREPHYYSGDTYRSAKILLKPGTHEWEAYMAGYDWNEESGGKKRY